MTFARSRPFARRASISVPAGACAASRSSAPSSARLTTAKPRPSVASGLTASSVREASARRCSSALRLAGERRDQSLAQRRRVRAQHFQPVPRIFAPQPRAQRFETLLLGGDRRRAARAACAVRGRRAAARAARVSRRDARSAGAGASAASASACARSARPIAPREPLLELRERFEPGLLVRHGGQRRGRRRGRAHVGDEVRDGHVHFVADARHRRYRGRRRSRAPRVRR